MTISAMPAALFRLVAAGPITILFDEVDAVFNQKGEGNEDLRGLLNAGYKNAATVARCVGDAKPSMAGAMGWGSGGRRAGAMPRCSSPTSGVRGLQFGAQFAAVQIG
jgi:hypothetical protein